MMKTSMTFNGHFQTSTILLLVLVCYTIILLLRAIVVPTITVNPKHVHIKSGQPLLQLFLAPLAGSGNAAAANPPPWINLHVGPPKTGTTTQIV